MPPQPVAPPTPSAALRVLECAKCGTPGRAETLPGGECGPCRGAQTSVPAGSRGIPADGVRGRMAEVRAAMAPRPKRQGVIT
ncbi:hypothetical protein [Streptomyces sp. NPDC005125]